jgi:putative oxidoreductase
LPDKGGAYLLYGGGGEIMVFFDRSYLKKEAAVSVDRRLPLVLLLLRLGVFIVMFMWTLDKFVRPEHAAGVYEYFYFLSGLPLGLFAVIGGVELLILIGFLVGFQKRFTYGAVLILHGISTVSSFRQYLAPFEDPALLFFAAWPMLAASFALYYLRDADSLWTVK